MNGTIIDIPGITVSVHPISLEDSSDKAHIIIIKDEHNKEIKIEIIFDKIHKLEWKK